MDRHKVVALAGGVGGAKLVDGLAQVLQRGELTVIVNTADDFIHLGLSISPDLDTICYTLAGMADPITGWGRVNDTYHAFENLVSLGMPDWFKLGDADLATHIYRTSRLSDGKKLSQITRELCQSYGINVQVLPMSDEIVRTWIYSDEGDLPFQDYFVRRKCQPVVTGFKFEGIDQACPAPGVFESIAEAEMIIFCPSNPFVSIDPILSVPKLRPELKKHTIAAVSPIIGNRVVKGPAAKMFSELGIAPSAYAVAQHYQGLIDWMVIDQSDHHLENDIQELGIQTFVTDILMNNRQDRHRLAKEIIDTLVNYLKR